MISMNQIKFTKQHWFSSASLEVVWQINYKCFNGTCIIPNCKDVEDVAAGKEPQSFKELDLRPENFFSVKFSLRLYQLCYVKRCGGP